jgi:broad specificity phosphatase PhoE
MAPPSTLVLIRHGHVVDNDQDGRARLVGRFDVGLSARGCAEAAALAISLACGPRPQAFYSSPLVRARQTAGAIAASIGLPYDFEHDLAEIDCGSFEGQVLAALRAEHPGVLAANDRQQDDGFRWPGGESYREFRARVEAALDRLAARHAGGTVWIVTHAGVISQAVGAVRGMRAARWGCCRPDNCRVTRLRWTPGMRGAIVDFNVAAGSMARVGR